MFKRKKWLAVALTALMALGLTGCGSDGQKSTEGKTEVTFWHVYSETSAHRKSRRWWTSSTSRRTRLWSKPSTIRTCIRA